MSSLARAYGTTSAASPYPSGGGYGMSSSTSAYGSSGVSSSSTLKGGHKPVQEEEVDALTDLLVQSMQNAADPEFFGRFPGDIPQK